MLNVKELFMKKKIDFLVMLVCLTVLSLVFIGCPTGTGSGSGGGIDIGNYTGIYVGDHSQAFRKSSGVYTNSAKITPDELIIDGEHYSGAKVSGGASQSVNFQGQTFPLTWVYLEVENKKAGVIVNEGGGNHELFLGENTQFSFAFMIAIVGFDEELPDWDLVTWDTWEGEGEKDD
jgi:hypothetical protein